MIRSCVSGLLIALAAAALSSVAESKTPRVKWMPEEYRRIDGAGNNIHFPDRGRAGIPLLRATMPCYADGIGAPPTGLPSPRLISNVVVAQPGPRPSLEGASDFIWQWGQFLDHDMDLSLQRTGEPFPVPVPAGDPFFDPGGTGTAVIPMTRSNFVMDGARQQVNVLTAFIDASNVYGSDPALAAELRTLDGTGRLKTSAGNLLPFNVNGFDNAPDSRDPSFFLAGDMRSNEQVGLTAMHTLFVREHNYWAAHIRSESPGASDEEIYRMARTMVGAEMQVITYREFLPKLLGAGALRPYRGYDPEIDPGILNEFSTAAFRIGHSLLSPELQRLDARLAPIPAGPLPLRAAFFAPGEIPANGGIEPLLRGLARQRAQQVDPYVVDDVRNFLFGPPGAGGFDLPSLNIQRGRDHGIPRYNEVRRLFGLPVRTSFAGVTSDPEVRARLAAAYATVDDIDLWIGALAEDHVPGALVGELTFTILRRQFEALRDGDRFWYENHFPQPMIRMLERQTLAEIIRRNTSIGNELQDDVFTVPDGGVFATAASGRAGGRPGAADGLGAPDSPASGFAFEAPSVNPVPAGSAVSFALRAPEGAAVRVAVFDVQGRQVRLLAPSAESGADRIDWDGRGNDGVRRSGLYFVRAEAAGQSVTRKVALAE